MKTMAPASVVLLLATTLYSQSLIYQCDFESTTWNTQFALSGKAAILSDASKVPHGSSGVLMSGSTPADTGYMRWMASHPDVIKLSPGNRYCVGFKYHIIAKGASGSPFLFFHLRSKKNPWQSDYWNGFVSFDIEHPDSGKHYTLRSTLVVPDSCTDAQLVFGIHDSISVVFDDISVVALPNGYFSKAPQQIPAANYRPFGVIAFFNWDKTSTHGYTDDEIRTCLDLLKNNGYHFIRVHCPWQSVESKEGSYDSTFLRRLDYVVTEAAKRSIDVVWCHVGVPRWASNNPSAEDYKWWGVAPGKLAQYGNFIDTIARRYQNKVHASEISLEVNGAFWKGSIESYAQALKTAYTSFKAADPTYQVVIAGFAPDGEKAPFRGIKEGYKVYSLQRLYDLGVKNYFDIMSVHPFTTDSAYAQFESIDYINKTLTIMRQNGDGNKRIWALALGCGSGIDYKDTLKQAAVFAAMFGKLVQHPQVDRVCWFMLSDVNDTPVTDDNFTGLLRYDLTPKKAFALIPTLPKPAEGYRFVNYSLDETGCVTNQQNPVHSTHRTVPVALAGRTCLQLPRSAMASRQSAKDGLALQGAVLSGTRQSASGVRIARKTAAHQ